MRKGEILKVLIRTSRPAGWLITPFIFLAGLKISGSDLNLISTIQMLLLSFPFSLFLFGINDIYDYETDKLNPRKKNIEGGVLEPKYHKIVKISSLISAFVLLISSFLTKNLWNIFLMSLLLLLSYFYSTPPIRLKSIPIIDSLSNGLGFLLAFSLGYTFGNNPLDIPIKIYAASLGVAGVHSFSTIQDYPYDKKAKVRTISTVFGKRFSAFFSLILFVLSLLLGNYKTPAIRHFFYASIVFSLLQILIPSEKLNRILFKTLFVIFIYAFIVFIGIV